MAPDDFSLGASTRWSGDTKPDSAGATRIEHILVQRQQNPAELKERVARFFNLRGGNTPAKVLPNLRHTEEMEYPDAEALGPGIRSGIPQFKLLKLKQFVIVREERPR